MLFHWLGAPGTYRITVQVCRSRYIDYLYQSVTTSQVREELVASPLSLVSSRD
tara:strand:- start:2610 stop:2768 length:159 start_codon:yes stop_codon:yes gene_type:complete